MVRALELTCASSQRPHGRHLKRVPPILASLRTLFGTLFRIVSLGVLSSGCVLASGCTPLGFQPSDARQSTKQLTKSQLIESKVSKSQVSIPQAPRGSRNSEGEPLSSHAFPTHAPASKLKSNQSESNKIQLALTQKPVLTQQAQGDRGHPREDAADVRLNGSTLQEAEGQIVDIAEDLHSFREKRTLNDWLQTQLGSAVLLDSPGPLLAVSLLAKEHAVIAIASTGAVVVSKPESTSAHWGGQLSPRGLRRGRALKESAFKVDLAAIQPESGLVAFWAEGVLRVAELATGILVGEQRLIETRVTALSFQPGADALLAAGADGIVYRWKFLQKSDTKNPERYFGPSTVVSSVTGYPGGRVFFSGDWSGGLSAWLTYDSDVYEGSYDRNVFRGGLFAEGATRKKAARADTVSITRILVAPDGSAVLTVLQDGRVEWWMTRGFRKIGEAAAHKGEIYSAALSADGSKLASVGRDGKVKVFGLQFVDGTPPTATLSVLSEQDSQGARHVAFVNEKTLVAATSGGKLLSFNF